MFSTNAKPGMFGLDIALKENFLTYSTEFVLLIIRLVPGNVVMVAINMCGKIPMTVELRETMYYLLCFSFIYLLILFTFIITFIISIIIIIIIILKFITMFLSVNICKFCK